MMSRCRHMNNMRRVLRRYKGRKVDLTLQQCSCKELKHVKIKRVCKDIVLVKKRHERCIYIKICCICTVDPVCECNCKHDDHDDCC